MLDTYIYIYIYNIILFHILRIRILHAYVYLSLSHSLLHHIYTPGSGHINSQPEDTNTQGLVMPQVEYISFSGGSYVD